MFLDSRGGCDFYVCSTVVLKWYLWINTYLLVNMRFSCMRKFTEKGNLRIKVIKNHFFGLPNSIFPFLFLYKGLCDYRVAQLQPGEFVVQLGVSWEGATGCCRCQLPYKSLTEEFFRWTSAGRWMLGEMWKPHGVRCVEKSGSHFGMAFCTCWKKINKLFKARGNGQGSKC